MSKKEVPDNILDDKEFLEKILFCGSRCVWGFLGGMLLLMFMSQNLYQENLMYPYAAKIAALISIIVAGVIDFALMKLKGI